MIPTASRAITEPYTLGKPLKQQVAYPRTPVNGPARPLITTRTWALVPDITDPVNCSRKSPLAPALHHRIHQARAPPRSCSYQALYPDIESNSGPSVFVIHLDGRSVVLTGRTDLYDACCGSVTGSSLVVPRSSTQSIGNVPPICHLSPRTRYPGRLYVKVPTVKTSCL